MVEWIQRQTERRDTNRAHWVREKRWKGVLGQGEEADGDTESGRREGRGHWVTE